jgi:hypothetical protein
MYHSASSVFIFSALNFFLLLFISFIFWMAVDAAQHDKYWWIVLIFGIPLLGALAYFVLEKRRHSRN